MIFHQYQLSCLSLFSYLVGDESTGRAVVIDPQRDVSSTSPTRDPTACASSA